MIGIGIKDSRFSKKPGDRLKRFCEMSIIAHTLFSCSGEFVSSLITENIIPEEPDYEIVHNRMYSHIIFAAAGYDPTALKHRFSALIQKIRQNGISEEEFIRGKRILYADFADSFNSAEDCASCYMSDALEEIPTHKTADAISALTLDEVNRTARMLLKDDAVAFAVCYPKNNIKKKGQTHL